MDETKQEKYSLLHDESDLEEYEKIKVGQKMHQNGKSYIRRSSLGSTLGQPQWLCHTVFIMLLVCSQAALCIFVLTIHIDIKTIKVEHGALHKNTVEMAVHLQPIDNTSLSKHENVTQMGVEPTIKKQLQELNVMDNVNLLKRLHTLETNMKSLKNIVSSHGEDLEILKVQQEVEGVKHENALQRQLNNISRDLNGFHIRLEEGLDLAFSQISQLRDDVFFLENTLNDSKQERFGIKESTQKPTKKETMVQTTTHLLPTVPLTGIQILLKNTMRDSTTMPMSSQKDIPEEISIPFLKSRSDFQVFFYGADKDANGFLTYAEIKNVLGDETPSEDILLHFDEDQDTMYSYTELIRTFHLKE
ncbi:EF-hand calcium-binding domain-containing protein 14 isoform X2 [Xenopus laevis]|uniref:EF-hand calcium-binding domain-containing protein 14 isoform X2 n=1 Tax=Xenopus laevis TaxID=8355 RepID=A0A8J1MWW4_XENLA|nr:EF-hand calcium-binding domain-containing protein 14 isoform X2 [Xenopus laevis]